MFKSLPCVPEDPTFKLLKQFRDDPRKQKVNLGIGLYFDSAGDPFVFDTVKKAAQELDVSNFNYLPIGGDRRFLDLAAKWFFGDDYDKERMAMQATCGGTQACRCFADLAMEVLHNHVIQIATPTWVNYWALFGQMEIETFDHCVVDEDGCLAAKVNFDGYLKAAKEAPEGSAFLLQGGLAHNPTGVNLSIDQLGNLIDVLEEKKMIMYMDMAYFGLSEGAEKDREYVKYCFDNLERFAVGVSFSKNASLYEHRCGALFIKTVNGPCVESQLQKSIRETISMPPGFGQEIMTRVLGEHRGDWAQEVEKARLDIEGRRATLVERLPERFKCLADTRGMFGLLPLEKEQILRLRSEFGIYVLDNGRINFAGIQDKDVEYIVESIKAVAA
jgi:aspartate/tyrosine/aromatic aminotransferase